MKSTLQLSRSPWFSCAHPKVLATASLEGAIQEMRVGLSSTERQHSALKHIQHTRSIFKKKKEAAFHCFQLGLYQQPSWAPLSLPQAPALSSLSWSVPSDTCCLACLIDGVIQIPEGWAPGAELTMASSSSFTLLLHCSLWWWDKQLPLRCSHPPSSLSSFSLEHTLVLPGTGLLSCALSRMTTTSKSPLKSFTHSPLCSPSSSLLLSLQVPKSKLCLETTPRTWCSVPHPTPSGFVFIQSLR